MNYSIVDGCLEIRDPATGGELKWRGNFGARSVYRALPLPGTMDCVVIVDYPEDNIADNLMRIAPDGTVVWRASPAPEYGSYADVMIQDGRIIGHSWSSYNVMLDKDRGTIVTRSFTK